MEQLLFGAPQLLRIQPQSYCTPQPLLLLRHRSDLALDLSHTVHCPLSKSLDSLFICFVLPHVSHLSVQIGQAAPAEQQKHWSKQINSQRQD